MESGEGGGREKNLAVQADQAGRQAERPLISADKKVTLLAFIIQLPLQILIFNLTQISHFMLARSPRLPSCFWIIWDNLFWKQPAESLSVYWECFNAVLTVTRRNEAVHLHSLMFDWRNVGREGINFPHPLPIALWALTDASLSFTTLFGYFQMTCLLSFCFYLFVGKLDDDVSKQELSNPFQTSFSLSQKLINILGKQVCYARPPNLLKFCNLYLPLCDFVLFYNCIHLFLHLLKGLHMVLSLLIESP